MNASEPSPRQTTFTPLLGRHPAAIQRGRHCCVIVGKSLFSHCHIMCVQDLDDAGLAEVIALPQFGCSGAVAIRLNQFSDRFSG